jgi:hypothetical protein
MLRSSAEDYSDTIARLRPIYDSLRLAVSDATVVVNSKALHHLLPELVPPIDRQYTVRFFTQAPDHWRDSKGKFRLIPLPKGLDAQFKLFHRMCNEFKRLADRVDPALFERERRDHAVPPPKALDNAIVRYVRAVSKSKALGA